VSSMGKGDGRLRSITPEGLYWKAKHFMDRAMKARNDGDYGDFYFWASLSLELLAKSTLAWHHPSLVVAINSPDQGFKNLSIACGVSGESDYSTVSASELYKRCRSVMQHFSDTDERFCKRVSILRNQYLHSPEFPFQVPITEWQSDYWRIVSNLLRHQERNLVDFLGEEEAQCAAQIIADAKRATCIAVRGRMEKHRNGFLSKSPSEQVWLRERATARRRRVEGSYWEGDATLGVACPACGCDSLLWGMVLADDDDLPAPSLEPVELDMFSQEFICSACDLYLCSWDEMECANLPTETVVEAVRRPFPTHDHV
jgi:hypothetical protein